MNKKYFAMALDPIHVGTGGYRLGRVDNSIVREPGTNLPKIPGSTIGGCARTYSSYEIANEEENWKNCAGKTNEEEDRTQCGTCPICITYGYSTKEKSMHGLAQFSDARILLFPVHSLIGPVWVTSPGILEEFGIEATVSSDKIKTDLDVPNEKLNLGWLYLNKEGSFSLPDDEFNKFPYEIKDKIVLVSDKLFSEIVNSNLEVRTSVSINPETGAAEEGALFTFEAIPRTTVFWLDVTFNDPKHFGVNDDFDFSTLKDIVESGFGLFETLGVGGMQTRGFGRLNVITLGRENDGE